MGMDWHSSGITTSVIGALKRGLKPMEHELGLRVQAAAHASTRERRPTSFGVRFGEQLGVDSARH